MTRVYHSESLTLHQEIELDNFASQHLSRVMRVKLGDEVKVFNASGEFIGEVAAQNKNTVRVLLKRKLETHTESQLQTTLIQAVTRRERMDYSIQKATELGVSYIQPVLSEHCVVKLDEKKAAQKIKHWQGIARHASEQCGRLSIPEIHPVCTLPDALINSDADLKFMFALQASEAFSKLSGPVPESVCVAVGPVGGFSQREVGFSLDSGFKSTRLGPRVLRSETATAAILTAVQMRWGDFA